MGLPLISAPNWIDATFYSVTFSTSVGSWLTALPLTNIKNPRFAAVARSNGLTTAATKMLIDLGTLRSIKSVCIPTSNASRDQTVRIRGYLDSGLTTLTLDSNVQDYWRTVYAYGSLAFEHPSWLDGKITDEERAGYPMPFVFVLDSAVLARYILIEFVDTANPDGYLDIPRIYICPGWEPAAGIVVGADLGYEDPSVEEKSLGSVFFFDVRPGFRRTRFTIPYMEYSETFTSAWELIRQLKRTKELFFSLDPTDDTNLHRWSFPATCKEVPQIQFQESMYQSVTFELREVIG